MKRKVKEKIMKIGINIDGVICTADGIETVCIGIKAFYETILSLLVEHRNVQGVFHLRHQFTLRGCAHGQCAR